MRLRMPSSALQLTRHMAHSSPSALPMCPPHLCEWGRPTWIRETRSTALIQSRGRWAHRTWQSIQFHVGYFEDRLDAGFQQYLNGPFTAAALTALKFKDFSSRRMISAGIVHSFAWPVRVSLNYWRTLQTGKTASLDGNASQFELVADYNVSKRTDVYVKGNYALYRGELIGTQIQGVNGLSTAAKGTQLGLMAGLRHQF